MSPVEKETARAEAERWLLKGRNAVASEQPSEAEAAFEHALSLMHDFAPAHHALGQLKLRQERYEDAADSLQLAVLFAPERAEAHAELALAFARQGMHDAARHAAEEAIRRARDSLHAWTLCAQAFKALGELDRAADCYEAALRHHPDVCDLICQAGYVHFLRGAYDAAFEAYQAVLAREPDHLAALHNLGLLELETGLAEQALGHFQRAAAIAAGPATLACIGHALRDLNRLREACSAYEKAIALDPEFGDARINLSYALLMLGDLSAGWALYESRFSATGSKARDFGLPYWRGEPLAGRRLLVFAEQGLGDEIMFASCIRNAIEAADQCVIECNTRLAGLFARSFPDALVHGGEKAADTGWLASMPRCDYQIAIGSLPRYFRPTAQSFSGAGPYLAADPSGVARWRSRIRLDDRLHIGIAWRGGNLRARQWLRSIPLAQWSNLLGLPDCRFVTLQHGECEQEIAQATCEHGISVLNLNHVCSDIDDLASVVCALDLVITVDNTLAHLAGALGREAWVLLPVAPEWRYPRQGSHMPWYGPVRLYRRTAPQDASGVMGQIVRDVQLALQRS